jgi:predicted chitinase
MGLDFDINKAVELYKKSGASTQFTDSLKQVLRYAQKSDGINSISDLAYLLATAKSESDYSLQRWEADYLCNSTGKAYVGKPCQRALDYYRSTNGKANYYNLGTDKNGLPYFGRGLIQLTGKSNYKYYGDKLGINLINNANLALVPINSFNIATTFMNKKRGGKYAKNGTSRSTFDIVRDGDLRLARISVNGGTKSLSEINKNFALWKNILAKVKAKPASQTNNNLVKILVFSAFVVSLSVGAYFLIKKTVK